ncbi:uncharacterized protein [Henckelia pumila]|uniref:uncharacterized protein n=1 Tax=Henckelia pumila TaxID=405737 RepID=UPI003C6DD7BF
MTSLNKIHMFSKEDYDDCKIRMQAHNSSRDDDMWYVITDGPMKILKFNTAVSISGDEPQMVENPRVEWNNEDKKKENLDNMAKDILYKMLDKKMFSKIKTCSTAKEIYEKLTQLCKENDQTKENKLTVAIQMFDNAKMKSGETMAEFDEIFSNIICELIVVRKIYTNREISLKVMRALPREWDVKTIAMRESKDLNKLELHDLFADLKAYELELGIRTEEEPSVSNPTKALTSTVSPQPTEEASAKKTAEQMSGEAMSLFIKRFGKFMHFTKSKNEERKQNYEKKKGKEGRRTFRKKKEQRVLVANEGKSQWAETDSDSSDTDSSSKESEEEQVQCLMANSQHEEDDTEVFDFNSSDFTQEELIQALNEMVTEYKKLSTSFEEAKTKKACLIDKSRESSCLQQKELDSLRTKLNLLAAENDDMKLVFQATLYENQKLLKTINSWNNASTSLDKIHENQKQAGGRTGLGYGSNECTLPKKNTQSYSSGNDLNVIRFVRSSTIYEHAKPKIYDEQSSRYESKGKHKGLGYVEPKIPRKGETWNKTRLNEKRIGNQSKFKQSRLDDKDQKFKQYTIRSRSHTSTRRTPRPTHFIDAHTGKTVRVIQVLSVKSVEKNSPMENTTWYLDSGCSRHMTGNKDLLSEIIQYKGPKIIFGDNSKGRTVGKGKITHCNIIINDVLFVDNLCYNLINISQLCDNGYTVEFHKHTCMIKSSNDDIMLTGLREQNAYRLNWQSEQPGLGEMRYTLVIVDDYSSFTWGIKHELSAARTPQQNGVAERRNRTLKEAARTMIADSNVSQRLWAEAINTTCNGQDLRTNLFEKGEYDAIMDSSRSYQAMKNLDILELPQDPTKRGRKKLFKETL